MNNVYMTFYYECVVKVFVLNLRYCNVTVTRKKSASKNKSLFKYRHEKETTLRLSKGICCRFNDLFSSRKGSRYFAVRHC